MSGPPSVGDARPSPRGLRRAVLASVLTLLLVIAVSLALQTWRLFEPSRGGLGPVGTLHSVLLTNNQVYYGTVQEIGPDYIVLSKVFYVETAVDEKTNARSNKLVERATTDWHAPISMTIPLDKIMFMEVVGPSSTVAKLIAEAGAKH